MNLLKPVRQQTVSEQVCEQIKALILKGRLRPGEQLVPERDMARIMKVSRTTVRTAINRLVTLGLVSHTQGSGTFVAWSGHRIENPFSAVWSESGGDFEELMEVKAFLECEAVSLAAVRAGSGSVDAIGRALGEGEKKNIHARSRTRADIRFHMAIAHAAKNRFYIKMMQYFYDCLSLDLEPGLDRLYEDRRSRAVMVSHHRQILTPVRSKDPLKARYAMQDHQQFIREAIAANTEPGMG